ncbi:sugar phosphate isomerase/epimerase family protein [Agathobaculum sp.]|uniref:sugar phosphate isomerase/epimerase family protein n=1 Tax=Agathobaculum sp. TaxID=2048138 RepID=UPI002A82AE93|nr:sugar phosphate isomerase/epimerase [Agathobaculum sp.]MDY3617583.1 sugar phosphate isomerase/epimerase [Agathobaculum sp.]
MELCYNLQTCSETSTLDRDVRLCAEAGFPLIEIDFQKARQYLQSHSLDDLTGLLRRYGLKCATINAIFSINFCSEAQWADICSQFDFACDLGRAAGADTVIVLSSERADLPDGWTPEAVFEDTAAALHRLADLGRNSGMKIAFEPVGTMAIGDIATAWRLVREVDRPEVGLAVDDFNLFLWDVGADFDMIRGLDPEKIFIAHINDADAMPFAQLDQMHRCMPGDGRIDVRRYMDCLRACGYRGPVSVEVLNPRIWARGPETVIPEAYERLRKFVF